MAQEASANPQTRTRSLRTCWKLNRQTDGWSVAKNGDSCWFKKAGVGGGGQGIFGKWGTAHHSDPVIEMDFENKSQDLAVKMVTRNDPAGKQAAG